MAWLPIRYRDFYDVPRAFLVERDEATLFFDCPFDAEADGYPDRYCVYRLSPDAMTAVRSGSWVGLEQGGTLVGEVPVADVRFDPTCRAAVDDRVLRALIRPATPIVGR